MEKLALDSLPPGDDREYLSRNLDPQRFKQIEKKYDNDGDAARRLVNYLNIADALRLATKEGSIRLDDDVIKNLVADYGDVKKLASVKRECMRILGA